MSSQQARCWSSPSWMLVSVSGFLPGAWGRARRAATPSRDVERTAPAPVIRYWPSSWRTAGPAHSTRQAGPIAPLPAGGFLRGMQLQPLEQGGTRQQQHSGGDQRDPGGRSASQAPVRTCSPKIPMPHTAATSGLARVISGWEATSRPACKAF